MVRRIQADEVRGHRARPCQPPDGVVHPATGRPPVSPDSDDRRAPLACGRDHLPLDSGGTLQRPVRSTALLGAFAIAAGGLAATPGSLAGADPTPQTVQFGHDWADAALIATDDDWSGVVVDGSSPW